jgi:predicted aminopeptidase
VNRLLVAVLSLLAAGEAGCWSGNYLVQQGVGQLKLLRARRRITEVLGDPTVDAKTKARLRLAVAARTFGVEVLGLRGGDTYTRYLETHGAPVAWNLSAAPKDQLKPRLHHFPITGAVPYLGFFREADARREEERQKAQGFDTYLRPVSGYSTLGITSDPVYSSMLEGGDAHIVEVVLHEMLHGTLYLKGHSEWNESVATFVGYTGAALFFAMSGGGSRAAEKILAEAQRRRQTQEKFSQFIVPVIKELEALYASPISREEKLRRREEVFDRARESYLRVFPPRPGKPGGGFAKETLNNAVVVAHAVYHRSTGDHERAFRKVGRDLQAFIALYKKAADRDNPLAWLKRYVGPQKDLGAR